MADSVRLLAWLVAVFAVGSADAEAPPWAPAFRYGVSYTFEQMSATREVGDNFDSGQITLVANVYRPVKIDRHRVVLFSHGSTGGWVRSPKETSGGPPASVLEFFISRGFTVVAPMRRGVGFSSGAYREECPLSAGQCSVAENTASGISGLEEAIRDTDAVIDQIVLGKLVRPNSKILLSGVSRGGFLSLIVAGRRPEVVAGVVSFVGGWLAIADQFPESEKAARMKFQEDQLARAGKRATVPTTWIYAARDPYYSETVTRQFFGAFREAGGQGDYVFVGDHPLESGHRIAEQLSLWESGVDQFLGQVGN